MTEICTIEGCSTPAHGRGLCRPHYDEQRYAETSTRSTEAKRAQARELAVDWELRFGPAGESVFASDSERREAWEERRDELLASYLTPPLSPGGRPLAFWEFEAGRPQHTTEYPICTPRGEATGRAIDEHDFEPVLWLAEHGHLTAPEVEQIRREAIEASARVGTNRERRETVAISQDRSAVRLAIRVDEALGEPCGAYGPDEPPYRAESDERRDR